MSRIEQIADNEVLSIDKIKEKIKKEIENIQDISLKVIMSSKIDTLAEEYQNMLKLEEYSKKNLKRLRILDELYKG